MSAGVAQNKRYPRILFLKNYNVKKTTEDGAGFNGRTKDRKKERFQPNDFPMLVDKEIRFGWRNRFFFLLLCK